MSAVPAGYLWVSPEACPDCAFCRRGLDQVVRLVVMGADAAICSECLGAALDALRDSARRDAGEGRRPSPLAGPLWQARKALQPAAPRLATVLPFGGGGGFTGDMCDHCGSFQVIRTGTCGTCINCGETTGGCS